MHSDLTKFLGIFFEMIGPLFLHTVRDVSVECQGCEQI
jgi:hypothetical protein